MPVGAPEAYLNPARDPRIIEQENQIRGDQRRADREQAQQKINDDRQAAQTRSKAVLSDGRGRNVDGYA